MASSKTASSTPRLSEYARKFVYPPTIVKTVWPRVEAKGKELGLGFDWWQSQLGTVVLGYDENGKYVATVGGIGLSIPRQVGKTYFVLALLFILCILYPGFQVVWTSHHMRTTNKTLTTAKGMARRTKIAPHIRTVRATNGEGQVEFANGSVIMFGARSQGFGRGFDEIDAEVFDEAQILDTKALEDMVAATNQARHEHGALLFYMGTPPRPTDPSEAFTERRTEAWSGEPTDSIWCEIAADPKSNVNDPAQYPKMNPSFPTRTPIESLLRLRKNLKDDDSWNREGRGVWPDENAGAAISQAVWGECLDPASQIAAEHPYFALDVSPAQTWATIAVAGAREDGVPHVEVTQRDGVVDHREGTAWIVPRLVEIAQAWPSSVVYVAAGSAACSLIPAIEAAGVSVETLSATETAPACGHFYQLATTAGLRHLGQGVLDAALAAARQRDIGDGAWAWTRRKSSGDITALYAATVALWAQHTRGTGDITQAIW